MIKLFCLTLLAGTFVYANPPQSRSVTSPENEISHFLGAPLTGEEFDGKESSFFPRLKNGEEIGRVEIHCTEGWDKGKSIYIKQLTFWNKTDSTYKKGKAFEFDKMDACFSFMNDCERPSRLADTITPKGKFISAKCGSLKTRSRNSSPKVN